MIYSKDATFPYPVLSSKIDSYCNNRFKLDVDLKEDTSDYFFDFTYQIESRYIQTLLESQSAKLIFVIQSKDNKFFVLDPDQNTLHIPKNRLSLNSRTTIQMMIRAESELDFAENTDLIDFYNNHKSNIRIAKHAVLGLSDIVIFDGSQKKPFELFEKALDTTQDSDVKIVLGLETILISYKSETLQFNTFANSTTLNYPYVYMGMQKALYSMIRDLDEDRNEELYLDEMLLPTHGLYAKLYMLMQSKNIKKLSYDNIDTVIYKISDRILEKFTLAIKGLQENGN